MKLKMNSKSNNNNFNQNNLQMKNSGIKYSKLQDSSNASNIGANQNYSFMSEIKAKNIKEENNNVVYNSSSQSSSSSRRRREKKKSSKNNMNGYGEQGIQNEIKEQIKQYVIDEHNNNV